MIEFVNHPCPKCEKIVTAGKEVTSYALEEYGNGNDDWLLCGECHAKKHQVITVKQVSEIIGISPRRVRAIAQARGVGRKLGSMWVFDPSDIERLRPGRVGRPRKDQ